MTDEQKPMTNVKLAAIRARAGSMAHAMAKGKLEAMGLPGFRAVEDAWDDRIALLAEVQRLRRALNPNWMEAAEIEHVRVKELEAENAAMRAVVAAIVAAQDTVKSAEMRWHQVTRTDNYPESEVRQADREQVMALRTRDTAIEQARAYFSAHPAESEAQ